MPQITLGEVNRACLENLKWFIKASIPSQETTLRRAFNLNVLSEFVQKDLSGVSLSEVDQVLDSLNSLVKTGKIKAYHISNLKRMVSGYIMWNIHDIEDFPYKINSNKPVWSKHLGIKTKIITVSNMNYSESGKTKDILDAVSALSKVMEHMDNKGDLVLYDSLVKDLTSKVRVQLELMSAEVDKCKQLAASKEAAFQSVIEYSKRIIQPRVSLPATQSGFKLFNRSTRQLEG